MSSAARLQCALVALERRDLARRVAYPDVGLQEAVVAALSLTATAQGAGTPGSGDDPGVMGNSGDNMDRLITSGVAPKRAMSSTTLPGSVEALAWPHVTALRAIASRTTSRSTAPARGMV